MRLSLVLPAVVASCGMLVSAERPDFTGNWRLSSEDVPAEMPKQLNIEQSAAELHIRSTSDPATDISCSTEGKDCKAKVNGKPVTVSYYYNGPALVGWVKEGKKPDRVRKVRRRLSPDGTEMTVEIEQIVPPERTRQTIVYMRDQQVASAPAAVQE